MDPDFAPANDPVRQWIEVAALSDTGPLSHVEKVRRWGKAWHDIMRQGFGSTLRAGEEARVSPP
jgi:hypothetical protein